eukprot:483569-Pelagomonas_calceolata.AAC.5
MKGRSLKWRRPRAPCALRYQGSRLGPKAQRALDRLSCMLCLRLCLPHPSIAAAAAAGSGAAAVGAATGAGS